QVGRHPVEEYWQFSYVVLAVADGIEEKLLPRGGETASQGDAIPAIHPEGDYAKRLPMALPRTVQHFGGLVAAAVVDHDDFGVIGRKKTLRLVKGVRYCKMKFMPNSNEPGSNQ